MARKNTNQAKSCVPQLFDNAEPGQDWSLDELSNYARIQYREILDGEKSQVQIYWRLGAALVLAKKAFKHGKWSQHLKELGIERTRASRARAIYQTFPEVEDTAGLTVAEAYDRRGRKQPSADSVDSSRQGQETRRLRKSVRLIGRKAKDLVQTSAATESQEAVILIPAVRKAIHQLQEFLDHLEQQVDEVSDDRKS
jgi:hypothetical protein